MQTRMGLGLGLGMTRGGGGVPTENLLTNTENFGSATWTKANTTVTVNSGVAPNGTTTADTLTENAANSVHTINQTYATAAATQYTFSIYVKANGRSHVDLSGVTGFTTNPIVRFTLSGAGTSSPRQGNPAATHAIENVGSDWYRCQINVTTVAGGSTQFQVNLAPDASSSSFYTGNGTSGVLLWGAQLETGAPATAYNKGEDT